MEKTNLKQRNSLINEAIDLLLKRAGVSKKDIYDDALKSWANSNIDLLTPAERQRYKSVIL
jgi:hypothetical protein